MPRTRLDLTVGCLCIVLLSACFATAWQQPPEAKEPSDPLLESIKERLGTLPRLDLEAKAPAHNKGNSQKYRAAELMLKSARLLESQHSEPLDQIANELRKQVVVVLKSD
jgi:hypothetical protein